MNRAYVSYAVKPSTIPYRLRSLVEVLLAEQTDMRRGGERPRRQIAALVVTRATTEGSREP